MPRQQSSSQPRTPLLAPHQVPRDPDLAAMLATMQAGLTANQQAIDIQANQFERFSSAMQSKLDQQAETVSRMISGIERLTDAMQAQGKNLDRLGSLQEALERDKERAHEHIEATVSAVQVRTTALETQMANVVKEADHGFLNKQNAPMWILSGLTLIVLIVAFIAPHWK